MGKAPPWDTPAWRLPQELRPIHAAVKRVRELEATPGVSPAEIAAARRAVAAAAVELTRRSGSSLDLGRQYCIGIGQQPLERL